jgi:lipid-binding SYLF domain-containing protein
MELSKVPGSALGQKRPSANLSSRAQLSAMPATLRSIRSLAPPNQITAYEVFLYKAEPTAHAAIQKSAGYAVFNNMGTNLLLVSTARGAGVAVNTKSKQETFMKMASAGGGLGVGVKDYRVIFVFENDKALFLDSGWSGSGQADAAAKAGEKGGAYSGAAEVAPGVWVYQITKNGLALHLTLQGTKYYKDDDLNKSRSGSRSGLEGSIVGRPIIDGVASTG